MDDIIKSGLQTGLQTGLNSVTGGIGGALVGGLTSLFSDSDSSMWEQHKMNKDMAMLLQGYNKDNMYLQRQLQEQAMHQQQAYNYDLMAVQDDLNYWNWKKQFDVQTKYNDPSNQRALLEKAGFNPYNMAGSGTTGVATGSPTGTGTAMPSSPSGGVGLPSSSGFGSSAFQDVPYVANNAMALARDVAVADIQSQTNRLNQTDMIKALIDMNKRDNTTKRDTSPYTAKTFSDLLLGIMSNQVKKGEWESNFLFKTQDSAVMKANAEAMNAEMTTQQLALQNAQTSLGILTMAKELSWMDTRYRAQLANTYADTELKVQQGLLSRAEQKYYLKKTLFVMAQTHGEELKNYQLENTVDDLIKMSHIRRDSMEKWGNEEGDTNNYLHIADRLLESWKNFNQSTDVAGKNIERGFNILKFFLPY